MGGFEERLVSGVCFVDCEGLCQLLRSTVGDDYVLGRLVTAISLQIFDLSYNILKKNRNNNNLLELGWRTRQLLPFFSKNLLSFSKLFRFTHHSADDFSKNNVSTIEPCSLFRGNEELRSICILSSISHGQPTCTVVLQLEVLVFETLSINAPTYE